MTDRLAYTPAGYRNMVKMSKFKYILVEGRDDIIVFKYLIHELFREHSDIQVHGAHQIRFGSDIGNRERVENISESLKGEKHAKRFVGFVDREFRGFNLDNRIEDTIGKHNIVERLIWARGHSIENYYFDFSTLRRALRHFSATPHFADALALFEQNMERIIILACAIGLTGKECGILEPLKNSIDWTVLEFDIQSLVIINSAHWSKNLAKKKEMRNKDVNFVVETFEKWLGKVTATDFNVVRWLCHGHIGITVIWAAYARCVLEACQKAGYGNPRGEASKVLGANETVRCNGCASEWVQQALLKTCEYPREIFTMLDLSH
jgi:hypothetical protein